MISQAESLARRTPIRVAIADADGLARRMLRAALDNAEGIAVVAETDNGREALTLTRYHRPSLVIVDAALPPRCVVELIGDIADKVPGTRVFVLATDPEDGLAIEALRAGAIGYLGKDVPPAVLPHLVGKANEGEPIVPRRLLGPILDRMRAIPDAGWRPVRSRLTTREWEIVGMIGAGATTQDIAECLVLSPTTVYSHVKSLMRKLGVHSRRDAVDAAERLRREEVVRENAPIALG